MLKNQSQETLIPNSRWPLNNNRYISVEQLLPESYLQSKREAEAKKREMELLEKKKRSLLVSKDNTLNNTNDQTEHLNERFGEHDNIDFNQEIQQDEEDSTQGKDDAKEKNTLFNALMDEYENAYETNQKPRYFEVIDKIYQNEIDEIESKIKQESPGKLKFINRLIDERIQKGTEILYVKKVETTEDSEKMQI